MKNKSTLLAAAVLGLAVSSYAQGIVTFGNSGGTKISINSAIGGPATSTTPATAGAYYYALFATTTDTAVNSSTAAVVGGAPVLTDPTWTEEDYGASTASAGRFGSSVADSNGNTAMPTIPGGNTSTYYVIVGWSSAIGSTYQNLENFLSGNELAGTTEWVGESNVGGPTPAGIAGSTPAATLFGTGSPYISGFTLGEYVATPEPTTIALGVMGAASMLALRRKKA